MELLTVNEAALALRVAPVTIRRYITKGRLHAVRVGRGIRIDKQEVERLPEPATEALPEGWPESARKYLKYYKPIPEGDYDPFGGLIGLADSEGDGPTDVSENKYEYLADAYADLHNQ